MSETPEKAAPAAETKPTAEVPAGAGAAAAASTGFGV